MEYDRFRDIIRNNIKYNEDVSEAIEEFNNRVNLTNVDIPKLIKEIGKKLDITIIEIPIKDSDFGAIFFSNVFSKYLLLNSNQPRNKMYFSFCHYIYHVLKGSTNYIDEKREVYLNNEYTIDPNECKANLFAANLLMPAVTFKKMYKLYESDSTDLEEIVLKLMNYFNSPFIAVLIRLFELQILSNTESVLPFLSANDADLKNKLNTLWIDDEILEPTLNDEMKYIFNRIKQEGQRWIESGVLSEKDLDKITLRLNAFYELIIK